MPNGSKSTRDYVIEMHTNMKYVKEWIEKHDKKHAKIWWAIITMFIIPIAIIFLKKYLGL